MVLQLFSMQHLLHVLSYRAELGSYTHHLLGIYLLLYHHKNCLVTRQNLQFGGRKSMKMSLVLHTY